VKECPWCGSDKIEDEIDTEWCRACGEVWIKGGAE
jgi:uncharacterized membrane protein YvbJ